MGFLFFIFGLAVMFGGLWFFLNALDDEPVEMTEGDWEEEMENNRLGDWLEDWVRDHHLDPKYSSLACNVYNDDD